MRRIKVLLIMVMLVVFSASNLAYAQTDMNLVVDVDEWEEIKKIVYGDNSLLSDMEINANDFASLKGSNDESEQVRQGYKLYALGVFDFVAQINSGKTLEELITEDYVWIVPTLDNQKIKVTEKKGEWCVSGYSVPSSVSDATDIIQLEDISTAAQAFSNDSRNIEKIQCIEAPLYHTNFVFILMEEGEFLIPYGSRPDLTGLENGAMYSVREVCDILQNKNHADVENSPNIDSGLPISSGKPTESEGTSGYSYVVIGTGVLILLSAFVFYMRKRE